MSELYHLHTKGIRDDKWKEKKEIIINDNFINRLGKRCNEFNDCINNDQFSQICNNINNMLSYYGYETFTNMPLHLVIDYLLNNNVDRTAMIKILQEVKKLSYNSSIFKREMAMEQFRKDNNNSLPSRLHCIYATDEKGIDTWKNKLVDGDMDLYRIDVIDEPFKTSELFIPCESCSFEDIYKYSYNYWNPKFKNINASANEYLVKGKIKILEKVAEYKRI